MLKFQHIFLFFMCCAQRASNETVIFWLLRAIVLLLSLGVVASQLFAVLKHGIILKNMIEFCLLLPTYPTFGITHGVWYRCYCCRCWCCWCCWHNKIVYQPHAISLDIFSQTMFSLIPGCLCVRLCLMWKITMLDLS